MIDDAFMMAGETRLKRLPRPRFWLLGGGLIVVLVVLLTRSFALQVFQGSTFRVTAEGNRVAALPIASPRGIFYDLSGKALTENIASTDVLLDPTTLPTEEHEGYLVDRLPQMLRGVTPDQVREALQRARATQRGVVLKKAASHEEILQLEAAGDEIYGVRLVSALVRKYPYGEDLAHVLGYTGAVTAEELADDAHLLPIDTTGKTGLEKTYENLLQGEPGYVYHEVNAAGRPQKDLGRQEPMPGKNITLTLDSELQKFIVELFRTQERRGAVIALDPRDGAVRALVSFPTFDPNIFSQPGQGEAAASLTQAVGQPLFNRALNGAYPPGSTIKPFLATAGLEEGIVDAHTTILSTGGIRVGAWYFPDWKAGGHGVTDVKKAIAESVNTFFYTLTGGDDTHPGLGVEKATAYLAKFGWGEPTAIDVPNEGKGFLPSKRWKMETKGEPWYIGDTYHLGIGQGDVLVTPLQLASATAALANGKYLVPPHLSAEADTRQKRLPFRPENIATVREAMRQTVTDGSGRRLASFPIELAGKTGTAQPGGESETHAWFTSFGPYGEPQLVVTVLLENAGEGDDVAVPFAAQIWQWWLTNRHLGESAVNNL